MNAYPFGPFNSEPGTGCGRLESEDCGWPVRSGEGPAGTFTSEPNSPYIMVLGTKRIGEVFGRARVGETVLVVQDEIDFTELATLTFSFHFTQAPENVNGLRWALFVDVGGGEVQRVFEPRQAGGELFFVRRSLDVSQVVGEKWVAFMLGLVGG